jgi:tetratricopeptide (TPR) repeat protein
MRARGTAPGLIATAAALAAACVFAQVPPQAAGVLTSVDEQIVAIQSSQGINSPELIAPLTQLGLILREQEDLTLALAAFERARHVVRVNYGLTSFEEAPLLRQLAQVEERRGNDAAAWDLDQDLLGLIYRHPGPRAAPMLKEIADKRADVLRRYSAGEMPPQIMLGCYYAPRHLGNDAGCPSSGSGGRVKIALLDEARSYYMDTIAMVHQSEGRDADELPELYLALVRALYASPNEAITGHEGLSILRELHSLSVRTAEPLAVQMNALVDIADWRLRFAGGRKEHEEALEFYDMLNKRFWEVGMEPAWVDHVFSPSMPVVLPAFVPNPLVSPETSGSAGHIDVAFEITKYGDAKSIEFLDTSTNTTDVARMRLRDLINWSRFRPRVADGAFEDASRVVVRYYVNE